MDSSELSPATENLIKQLYSGHLSTEASHFIITSRSHQLENEIRVLRGHHNAATPVCRLPPEMLSTIFQHLLPEPAQGSSPYGRTKLPPDVVRATHVCRHWRCVALSCTSLWDNLDFEFPQLTDAMIDRSDAALLEIKYGNSPSTEANFLRVLGRLQGEKRVLRALTVTHLIDTVPWYLLLISAALT
jgi:hypothetical protein